MTRHPIPLSTSTMIQRLPKAAIPDGLSLSRYTLSNGASRASAVPLCILLPQQQWAYGVSFPLDHAALSGRSADAPCVVHVKLVVEGGVVGVAACDANGSSLTAPEDFAIGTVEIRITLERPMDTSAVVIRKAAWAGDVRISILEIGLFEAGEECLAPRRHDLGYDLFVILTAPKTGSQTIEDALYALSPFVRLYRVDNASVERAHMSRQLASSATACAARIGDRRIRMHARRQGFFRHQSPGVKIGFLAGCPY
jgi:hypothetical protein